MRLWSLQNIVCVAFVNLAEWNVWQFTLWQYHLGTWQCKGINHVPWDLTHFSSVFSLVYSFSERIICVWVSECVYVLTYSTYLYTYIHTHTHMHTYIHTYMYTPPPVYSLIIVLWAGTSLTAKTQFCEPGAGWCVGNHTGLWSATSPGSAKF